MYTASFAFFEALSEVWMLFFRPLILSRGQGGINGGYVVMKKKKMMAD